MPARMPLPLWGPTLPTHLRSGSLHGQAVPVVSRDVYGPAGRHGLFFSLAWVYSFVHSFRWTSPVVPWDPYLTVSGVLAPDESSNSYRLHSWVDTWAGDRFFPVPFMVKAPPFLTFLFGSTACLGLRRLRVSKLEDFSDGSLRGVRAFRNVSRTG